MLGMGRDRRCTGSPVLAVGLAPRRLCTTVNGRAPCGAGGRHGRVRQSGGTVVAAAADLVLVPVALGEADVIEAQRAVTFVAGLAHSARRAIPVRVIVNRVRRNTTLARHVAAEIERLGLPRLAATISEAVAYGELSLHCRRAARRPMRSRHSWPSCAGIVGWLKCPYTERHKGIIS
jgi:hypothetical protein